MNPWHAAEHAADLRLVVRARSWPELLAEAVGAFREVVGGGQPAPPAAVRTVTVTGADREEVWVRWWRELLRMWTVGGLLPLAADVEEAGERRVRATVRAAAVTTLDLSRCADVKAVTWHRARVQEGAKGWEGEVVLDV